MHESEVAQSCPTLRDPMDCSLPGSSVHGIFQAGVLEWGATYIYSYSQYFRPLIFILELSSYNVFIGRTGAEAEITILWPPDVKN